MISQETGRIASARDHDRVIKNRVLTTLDEPKPRFSKT